MFFGHYLSNSSSLSPYNRFHIKLVHFLKKCNTAQGKLNWAFPLWMKSLVLALVYFQLKFPLLICVFFGHYFSKSSSLSPYNRFPITLVFVNFLKKCNTATQGKLYWAFPLRKRFLVLAFRYFQLKFPLFISVLFGHYFGNSSSLSPYNGFPITLAFVYFFWRNETPPRANFTEPSPYEWSHWF